MIDTNIREGESPGTKSASEAGGSVVFIPRFCPLCYMHMCRWKVTLHASDEVDPRQKPIPPVRFDDATRAFLNTRLRNLSSRAAGSPCPGAPLHPRRISSQSKPPLNCTIHHSPFSRAPVLEALLFCLSESWALGLNRNPPPLSLSI